LTLTTQHGTSAGLKMERLFLCLSALHLTISKKTQT
jgi:hypothetical protein